MKFLASILILFYGGLLTFAFWILQGFGSSFAGMSAGTAGSASSSFWSIWPCPMFFALSSAAPFFSARKSRVLLLRIAISVLIIPSVVSYGLGDGLLFVAMIAVASLLVWVPLLARFAESTQQADCVLR